MGLYDSVIVSKEAIDNLKIVCPRCKKTPTKTEYQSKSFGAAMDEYHLRVANNKVRLYKDTGNFFEGVSGKTENCEPHGWVEMFGFCEECEKTGGKRLYDIILKFTDGVVSHCQTGEELKADIFGIGDRNEFKE